MNDPVIIPEISSGGDPLADIPCIFQAGPHGEPVFPPLSPDQRRAFRYDRSIQIGPSDMRSVGRSIMDIRHELILRGYHIEALQVSHKPPLIQPPPGMESDQHLALVRLRVRACANAAEEILLLHELGVIAAAHRWAQMQIGAPPEEPRLIIPSA